MEKILKTNYFYFSKTPPYLINEPRICYSSFLSQLAGALEYANYFSDPTPSQTSILNITLNNLMMRFQ